MYQFTDDCLIGVDQIDNEHRRLFELVNEVANLLIKNDINERNELQSYIKYCDEFFDQSQLSVPSYNLFRPITLNEIKDKKIYIEEELEKEYQKIKPKRLEIGYKIPDFYYKTQNYSRMKECIDEIAELKKILDKIESQGENTLQNIIDAIKDSIEMKREELTNAHNIIETFYINYIQLLSLHLQLQQNTYHSNYYPILQV